MLTGKFYSAEEIKDIKDKYPKFIKHVTMHLLNIPKDDYEQTMSQIPENFHKSSEMLVELMLQTAIRDLYDFFDEEGLVLDLDASTEQGKFFVFINGEEIPDLKGFPHDSRVEAEKTAFLAMMDIYEQR